ncbi:MAG: signal peptidase I [Planctomycetota bacterium]
MRSTTAFVRDNIEAFAVAIAMALVIRHFSVEAFRIPTGSMMPSLYGDSDPGEPVRQGDRILVDKYAYLRGDPQRWHVAVFQYPLDRTTNFIKRIVGLPDEWVAIADGDIWTSKDGEVWQIERKPPAIREHLMLPYWPLPGDRDGFRGSCWEGDDAWTEKGDVLSVDADESGARFEFARRIPTYPSMDPDGVGRNSAVKVGDIRFRAHVDVVREGELELRITEHDATHRLVLGPDESYLVFGGAKEERIALDFLVERGDSFDLSFSNVDESIWIVLDGEELLFEIPDLPTLPPGLEPDYGLRGKRGQHGFSLVARGLQASLEDARIDRDLHYLLDTNQSGARKWQVPADSYFVLGDNTNSSKDSRRWQVSRVVLQDGSTIEWEESSGPSVDALLGLAPEDEFVIPNDSQGLTRRLLRSDISTWKRDVAWPFVPRDHLIGRAFSVFWPIYVPPLYRGATRIQRIR